MRFGLAAWCALGAAVVGLKAHLDLSARDQADIAVRAAGVVYRIPSAIVTNGEGWRVDLMRLAGCWDVRHAGLAPALAPAADCTGARALALDLSRLEGRAGLLSAHGVDVVFWTRFEPPASHMQALSGLVGRVQPQHSSRWQLYRLDEPGTPWVYLLTHPPRTVAEASAAYAGRCYRADIGTDIGMTCSVVERLPGGGALSFSLGPEGVVVLPAVRAQAVALAQGWRM